jgi:hypothetical protein
MKLFWMACGSQACGEFTPGFWIPMDLLRKLPLSTILLTIMSVGVCAAERYRPGLALAAENFDA